MDSIKVVITAEKISKTDRNENGADPYRRSIKSLDIYVVISLLRRVANTERSVNTNISPTWEQWSNRKSITRMGDERKSNHTIYAVCPGSRFVRRRHFCSGQRFDGERRLKGAMGEEHGTSSIGFRGQEVNFPTALSSVVASFTSKGRESLHKSRTSRMRLFGIAKNNRLFPWFAA
jgi:hypothetical protein